MKLYSVEIFKELVINKNNDWLIDWLLGLNAWLLIDRFECLIIDKCQNN